MMFELELDDEGYRKTDHARSHEPERRGGSRCIHVFFTAMTHQNKQHFGRTLRGSADGLTLSQNLSLPQRGKEAEGAEF
jgi:hypothetical protein